MTNYNKREVKFRAWDVDVIIKRWEDYTGNKAEKVV